jgi:HK97 family phage major capsid protein
MILTDIKQLYSKKESLINRMESILEGAKKRGGTFTDEEKNQLEVDEVSLDLMDEKIEEFKQNEQQELNKVFRDAGGSFEGPKSENFSNAGIEIPIYNRRTKNSVRADFAKNNVVDESLKNMTFGRLLRAHLFGAKNEQEERALSEGTPSAGGYTVPQIVSADFIDRLRPISRVMQAGANLFTIDDKTNKYNLAKLTGGITIEWLAENAESTPADLTFGNVQFAFKTARAIVRVSNELVQDSLNLERVLTTESVRSFATEFDRVALVGNGTSEPKGIINYTDHETVSMTTNGAAPASYDEVIALIMELQLNNADVLGTTPAIMSPRTLAAYNVLKDSVNDQPLQRPDYIKLMPFLHTTSVPIVDTYGSSSAASKLFLGDWSQLYYGMRLGVTIVPLNQRYAEFNQTAFLIVARIDVQPYHEAAFGYIQGLLGATLPT